MRPTQAADTALRESGTHAPRRASARAPARIDFGGGWTDVPPYPERDGGFVCNVAIAMHARASVGDGVAPRHEALTVAALRRAGVNVPAAIASDFPVGAGLGGSSAAGVALQAAICALRGETPSRETLVQRSRAVEVEELGIAGGWQDHYAAGFGGALALDFGATTSVGHIPLREPFAATLAARCVLVHTGQSRISGANISAVLGAYAARDPRVTLALSRMGALAREMAVALRGEDIDALGALVAEHWTHQRALHPAITTSRIDDIVARATAAGALGAKALGASGGGCVAIVTPSDPSATIAAIQPHGTVIPYVIDMHGVVVEVVE